LSCNIFCVRHGYDKRIHQKIKLINMKDFMFIFRNSFEAENQSPEQMQASMQLWMAWIDKLRAEDRYAGGEPLIPSGKVVKGAQPLVTDGPFAESKEIIGGYFIVKAATIEEAAEMAKGCPDFAAGASVEVREIMKM